MSTEDNNDGKDNSADDPFEQAVRYAILGNIIDFAPGTEPTEAEIVRRFALDAGRTPYTISAPLAPELREVLDRL